MATRHYNSLRLLLSLLMVCIMQGALGTLTSRWQCSDLAFDQTKITDTLVALHLSADTTMFLGEQNVAADYRPTIDSKYCMLFEGEQFALIKNTGQYPFFASNLDNKGSTFSAWINIFDHTRDQVIFCKQMRSSATEVIDKLCVGIKDGYFYGNLYNETIPFEDFGVLEGWNFFNAIISKDSTNTYTRIRIVSFTRGGMQMSDRIWSYLYTDNVDYDMYIGAKYDRGGTHLQNGFAGYMLQVSLYSLKAMGMDDLDALVDWECDTPHIVNLVKPEFCRFCPTDTDWPLETCLEDTYDPTVADGSSYYGLVAGYDFRRDAIQKIDTRPYVENSQFGKKGNHQLYFGLPTPYPRVEEMEPSVSAMHGLYFDGDDRLSVSYNDPMRFGKHFTVEMWVRFTEPFVTQPYGLFEKVDWFGLDKPYMRVYFDTDGSFKISIKEEEILVIENAYDGNAFVGDFDQRDLGDSDQGGWLYVGVSYSGVYHPVHNEVDSDHHPTWESKFSVYLHGPRGYERHKSVLFNGYYDETYNFFDYNTEFGRGLRGFIRSAYIWDFPKPLNSMYFSVRRNYRLLSQCDTFMGNPIVECRGCDQIIANSECYTDCHTRTYATDWAQCPYQYCTNSLCVTCYADDGSNQDNKCTSCIPGAMFITENMGDCFCKMKTFYQYESHSCEDCHPWCQSCDGPTNTECNSCIEGKFYVPDRTCINDCRQLGNLWRYIESKDTCEKCWPHSYSMDNYTCTDQVRPKQLTNYNNEYLLLEFTEPVAYRDASIQSIFDIVINGTRSEYKFEFDAPFWEQDKFEKNVMISIEFFSSLNGDETLSLLINPYFIYDVNDFNIYTRNETLNMEYSPQQVSLEKWEYISLDEMQTIRNTGAAFLGALLITLLIHLLFFAYSKTSLELFWIFLNTLQIIDFVPLLNLKMPTTMLLTFKYFSFTNQEFDIFKDTFMFLFNIQGGGIFEPDGPLNQNFENYGKDSLRMIVNGASIFFIVCIFIVIAAICLIIRVLFGHCFACGSFWKNVERQFEYNGLLRWYVESFLALFLASILGLKAIAARRQAAGGNVVSGVGDSTQVVERTIVEVAPLGWAVVVSSLLSCLMFASVFLFVFTLIYRLVRYKESFETRWMQKRFSSVYYQFRKQHFFEYLHMVVFILRRVLYCLLLVFWTGNSLSQLVSFQLLNFCMLIILFFTRPYQQQIANYMAMFNEFMTFVVGCYMFAFLIDDKDESVHKAYARTILNILIFLCAVNLLVVIPVKLRELCLEYYRQQRIRRLKQMARVERRFREFDAMKYVLHGLHLKDHYRFVQRRKKVAMKTYEPTLGSSDSESVDAIIHNINFEGDKDVAPKDKAAEDSVQNVVLGAAGTVPNRARRQSIGFHDDDSGWKRTSEKKPLVSRDEILRPSVSQQQARPRRARDDFSDGVSPLPHNLDLANYNQNLIQRASSPQERSRGISLLDEAEEVVGTEGSQQTSPAQTATDNDDKPAAERSVFQSSFVPESSKPGNSVFQSSVQDGDSSPKDNRSRSVFQPSVADQSSKPGTAGQRSMFNPSVASPSVDDEKSVGTVEDAKEI